MSTTTNSAPVRSYRDHVSRVLFAAFALSAVHTVYVTVAGLADPDFTATSPAAWAFYALGFGVAAASRSDRRGALITVAVVLAVLLAVALFFYPTVFTARMQNTFGWLENDVYTALLVLAEYLMVLRLRGTTLVR